MQSNLSFTPGFNRVVKNVPSELTVSTVYLFRENQKTVKTVHKLKRHPSFTRFKPGVNESAAARGRS